MNSRERERKMKIYDTIEEKKKIINFLDERVYKTT